MKSLDFISIGHIVKEMIKFPDRTVGPLLGSPTAYSSLVASKLGVRTGVCTKIGFDMPEELLTPFSEANIDSAGIIKGDFSSTTTELVYDESGNKRIFYPKRAPCINFDDIPEHYLSAPIINVVPIDREVPIETIKRLKDVRSRDTILSVDMGSYGGAHSPVHPQDINESEEIVVNFNVVKASDEDCRYLFPEKTEDKCAELFVEWGVDVGIITLGSKGALLATKKRRYEIPPFRGNVVDPTGGGDSFLSGFLIEYSRTREPEKAGYFASAVALLMIKKTGGASFQRMPDYDEVMGLLKSEKINI